MARSLNARLRWLWLQVHLWIGVALMLAIIPLSVSGSLLVWHTPMERALHAERFEVAESLPVLPASAYLEAARQAFDGRATPASVRLPDEPGVPVTVVGQIAGPTPSNGRPQQLTAWLDPATAEVKDVANVRQSFFSIMHRLHGTLMIPEVGRKVVGWLGWAMTISCATGLWLWWPRNGAFLKGLRWRRTPMTMDNLHHTVGFWICIPLAVLSLTGVYISFPQTSRALFGVEQQARSGGRGRASPPPVDTTRLTIDAAVAAALAETPGGRPTTITLPTEGDEAVWRVQLAGAGAPATVAVADADARTSIEPGGGGRGRNQDPLSRWMRRVHDGVDMGLLWQTIIFLGGIAPALLSITGLVMWLRRQARKAALRKPDLAPAE